MEQNRTYYHITTEQCTYNAIESREHFKQIRCNCNDNTLIITAFYWTENSNRWQKFDAKGW